MKNKVKIPVAFQIRIDDVAWHNGADERHIGRPSRTGIARKHVAEDYPVLNELGKALNQKISCAIVLGEWDRENILRGHDEFTWCPDTWDRKSEIDLKYHEKAFELLENSEYIDYTCHGIMHGHYEGGRQITEREYYTMGFDEATGKEQFKWQSDDVLRKHIDYFFKLYNMWGFKKPIKSIACGNGCKGSELDEGNKRYAHIFEEYGFDVWQNGWGSMTKGNTAAVIEGLVALNNNATYGHIPWDALGVDPQYNKFCNTEDEQRTDLGYHWPNFLRWNPENNMEYLPKWVDYFKNQAEVFGNMISRDVMFAASQAVYHRYAQISFDRDFCTIYFDDVDNHRARALKNEFYVSIKNNFNVKKCVGGEIELYEEKKEFKTYKITRGKGHKVEIIF